MKNNTLNTEEQFESIVKQSKDIFIKKTKDYGTSWRILRPKSVTDQIYIKALRIRSIEDKGTQKVEDSIASEYLGILNYCVIALIQLELGSTGEDLSPTEVELLYNKYIQNTKDLMFNKNHDYGEAWRLMRLSSMTDIILTKLIRIKQIEDNDGKTIISEGVEAGYMDIINYAIFSMIKLSE
jgi:hypothetical protein